MADDKLHELLTQVRDGYFSPEQAKQELHQVSFKDLGYAKIDHHRSLRSGFPEVIYCEGKDPNHIAEIFYQLTLKHDRVLATRADHKAHEHVLSKVGTVSYNSTAKTIMYENKSTHSFDDHSLNTANTSGRVAVVSAGTSDMPVAEEAYETANIMGARVERLYDVGVAGIHRLLHHQDKLNQVDCIVVVAGMEGALASVVGGLVNVPVIACPTSVGYGANFEGLSSLLTMLNSCASGVSVVNIDNGFGAAYQAALIARLAQPKEV